MARILSDVPVLNAWTYNFLVGGYDPLQRKSYSAFRIIGIERKDYGLVVECHKHGKYPWHSDHPMFDTEEEVDAWMRHVNYDLMAQSAQRLLEENAELRRTARVNLRVFEERIDKLSGELKSYLRSQPNCLPRGRIRTR